jgi:Methionyl-tRNA formyltransferase
MSNSLSIGYFADGPWSYEAFKLLIQDKTINIKFICVRYDTLDETLKKYSDKYKIDYLKDKNINSKEFVFKLKEYNCDLFVSMSFNQIFKKEIIDISKLGIINCHAGKLPFYRGRNVLNWVLINDEKEFGITVHYIDEGIDTGDIIMQKSFPISDEDNYETLLQLAYIECANLLYESIKLIQGGNYKRIKQKEIHSVGSYCGMRQVGDEMIDWNQGSRDIFNFIRAICKPGPMGRSFINDKEIKINKSKMIKNAPVYKGIPGQVIGITDNGFIVKTKDSILEMVEYEYYRTIKIGDRLK